MLDSIRGTLVFANVSVAAETFVPRKQTSAPRRAADVASHPESAAPLNGDAARAGQTDEQGNFDALGELMLIQATMQRQFLRVIIRRLATDVPNFQSELFLAELQLMLDSLVAGKDKSALHSFAQKEWARLCEMAFEAIASTRSRQEAH